LPVAEEAPYQTRPGPELRQLEDERRIEHVCAVRACRPAIEVGTIEIGNAPPEDIIQSIGRDRARPRVRSLNLRATESTGELCLQRVVCRIPVMVPDEECSIAENPVRPHLGGGRSRVLETIVDAVLIDIASTYLIDVIVSLKIVPLVADIAHVECCAWN